MIIEGAAPLPSIQGHRSRRSNVVSTRSATLARFNVDESLRRARTPDRYEDGSRTVAAVIRPRRVVVKRRSLVALLVPQCPTPGSDLEA